MLTVVLSAGVLLIALVVATRVVLRAVRSSGEDNRHSPTSAPFSLDDAAIRLDSALAEVRDVLGQFERFESSVHLLSEISYTFDVKNFARSVYSLAEMQPTITRNLSRWADSTASSDPAEISDFRVVAELNHSLQTPLRGLGYAVRNLENLPDAVLIEERERRLAEMTSMLDNCISALATFRGLVDAIASVPARQPSLKEAIQAFASSLPHPAAEPLPIDIGSLPDRVDGFSNHYLLTMLQPLVENAIEGCAYGSTVEVACTDHGDAVEFTVFNAVDRPVDNDILFVPQRTTKDGHQGLGVSIVSRLAEFVRGDLTADITDTGVRMRVLLPRR